MAEQPSSSASSTDCGDVVKISKSKYERAVAQMKQQKLQIVAASNLHRLMQEKDEELMASKEEKKQLQLALQQSETRLSSMIRLQAATAATSFPAVTHALEADSASLQQFSLPQSDVETDGEHVTQPQRCFQTEKLANKFDSCSDTQIPVTLIPPPPVTSPLADVSSASSDTCSTHVTSLISSVTAPMSPVLSVTSATNPESKDLLDKVLQQNARLKKILRDLLSQKGLSVSTYLVCQDCLLNCCLNKI